MSSKLFGPSSREWNPLTLALLTALWIATAANWPLWRALFALRRERLRPRRPVRARLRRADRRPHAAAARLAAWRRTIARGGLVAHPGRRRCALHGTYGVVIDPTMMTNVLQTNPTETRDLLSLRLLASLFVLAALPIGGWRLPLARLGPFRARRTQPRRHDRRAGLGAALLRHLRRPVGDHANHKSLRYLINPHNSFYARAGRAGAPGQRQSRPDRRCRSAGCDARGAARRRQAAARPARDRRDRARRPLLAQRLRTRDQPAAGQARRGELPRRQLLRHQHRRLGALHGLAPRPRGLRRA